MSKNLGLLHALRNLSCAQSAPNLKPKFKVINSIKLSKRIGLNSQPHAKRGLT